MTTPVASLAEYKASRVEALGETRAHAIAYAWHVYQQTAAYSRAAATTKVAYERVLERASEALPPSPTAADVDQWLVKLRESGLSAASCNKHLAFVRAVVRHASRVTHHHELADDLEGMRRAPVPAARWRVPSDAACHELLEAAHKLGVEFVLAVRLCMFGALRIGEVMGARPDDLEIREMELRDGSRVTMTLLHVERTRDRFGSRRRKNAANGRRHIVHLDRETADLCHQAATIANHRAAFSLRVGMKGPKAEGWLLPWSNGYQDKAWGRLEKLAPLIRAEAVDVAWHCLRHWCATKVMARPGATTADVQCVLGDSTSGAACCYQGQLRGTTRDMASQLAFEFGRVEPGEVASSPGSVVCRGVEKSSPSFRVEGLQLTGGLVP